MNKRHEIVNAERTKLTMSSLEQFRKRITCTPPGVCPISMHIAYIRTARSQSCGKCVPCSKGLEQLEIMLQKILDGEGTMDMYVDMVWLAQTIRDTADCAIGYETANLLLLNLKNDKQEYMHHIENKKCMAGSDIRVPCMHKCPANVNIPGYIALVGQEKYAEAIDLIREDNPFPTACAYVCERPCELQCRRGIIDSEINIRGIKKFAVDSVHSDKTHTPHRNVSTGKKVAVVGGGPSGLTCAYFLARMGHSVTVYEGKEKLGGMLRYGIPNYRLPKDRLDEDINALLAVGGIEVKLNTMVGRDITPKEIEENFDAVYISIGAQEGRVIPIKNYDNPNVESAVAMLDHIGHGNVPDFTGKHVIVIGGGNVAMDCARSAIRCNAASVTLAVRERQVDMTAHPMEIQGAIEEGVELRTMFAPVEIHVDDNGNVVGLITQPQIIGKYDDNIGLPMVVDAKAERVEFPCDVLFMAIGQSISSEPFEGYKVTNRKNFVTNSRTELEGKPGVFCGGDCASGPATAVKAIGAGKIAAINIDEYLGYHHSYSENIEIPEPLENLKEHIGRVNLTERSARERKLNFDAVENGMSYEEAMQECRKCLRCDVFGSGVLEGGMK